LSIELGVTPESIALAGLENLAAAMLDRLEEAQDLRTMLAEQCEAESCCLTQLNDAAMLLASRPDEPALLATHAAAVGQLEAAHTQSAATRSALRDYMLEIVAVEQRLTLDRWNASATHLVPAAFRIQEHTASEWTVIEVALRGEERALGEGMPLETTYADMLAAIRSDVDVLVADQLLLTALPIIQSLFEEADVQ
jgi:hypothetical protein